MESMVMGAPHVPLAAAPTEPSLPISRACTQAQFDTPAYRAWCKEIREPPRYHRKQWEFCYILEALVAAGVVGEGRRGLGFGVGKEPLTAVLAARGCHITATDLDPDEAARAGWVDTNQYAAQVAALNERGICGAKRFAENVTFRVVDMNHIPANLANFDFTWSACSLEHLGSIPNGLAFIVNSLATLRPGGIAVHTTEFNCSSNDATVETGGTVLFRRRDIESLCAALKAAGHEVAIDFSLGGQPLDDYIDVAPYSADKHLKLWIGEYTTTSFGIVIRKGLDAKPVTVPGKPESRAAPVSSHRPTAVREWLKPLVRQLVRPGWGSARVLDRLASTHQEIVVLRREMAALRKQLATVIQGGGAARTAAAPAIRPYYYLGHGLALTQLSTGAPFFVHTRDRGITSWIVHAGVWETFVDDVLCALARPGQKVIDVGANEGYYTVKLAGLVGETGSVFSFEPNPELYSVLTRNVSINALSSRVRTYPFAAGDAPGRSVLNFTYENMGGGSVALPGSGAPPENGGDGGALSVEIARIDDVLPAGTAVDLIKIDAEGYEPAVLAGMRETLTRSSGAAIVLEIATAAWARFGDPLATLERARGERDAYVIGLDGRLTRLTRDELAVRLTPSGEGVWYMLLLPPAAEWKARIAKFLA